MSPAFVPSRVFFGRQLFARGVAPHVSPPVQTRFLAQAKLTARERRRAVEQARTNAHRDIKREIENRTEQLVSAVVSVPGFVRERCCLTPRMARVKVFLEKDNLTDVGVFRGRVHSGLVRLFPELEQRGLLRTSDAFDMKVGGGDVVQDSTDLRRGLEKCERVGSAVFVEVIPHHTPPPKPPLSRRVQDVIDKARAAMSDRSTKLHMISFYKFVGIERPDIVSELLQKTWWRMGIKGRVYVAREGVNAQLAVPENVLQDFYDAMNGSWTERGKTLVPSEVVGVFLNTDNVVHHSEQPFEKLSVRPRDKVLADGLEKPLDWNKAGNEVPADEWHRLLTEESDDVVVLDCRNSYESDVGRFEGAEPLNTRTFRESWDFLEERLQNEDRGKKILTYCTGGIRCVKVNAFLEQKMGFTNTGRLEGGIVSYARKLKESGMLEESAFKGVNHVFDGRMGEVITEDLLTRCTNCGQPCNLQTDCANSSCPRPFDQRMFVQCVDCAATMNGACSESCRQVVKSGGVLPEHTVTEANASSDQNCMREPSKNNQYADAFSVPERPLLRELREVTEKCFENRAHMLSSHAQASLLRMLIEITGGSRVLEIGTFTGYATIAMAAGLPANGTVITCELDDSVGDVAEQFFARDLDHGHKIKLYRRRAMETLVDQAEQRVPAFDVVFIDADKGGYKDYMDFLLDNNLVRRGGILIFDNVLFRGEVSDIWAQGTDELPLPTDDNEMVRKRMRNLENARRTAKKLHSFNQYIRDDERVDQVMLPFRDGLTIARRIR